MHIHPVLLKQETLLVLPSGKMYQYSHRRRWRHISGLRVRFGDALRCFFSKPIRPRQHVVVGHVVKYYGQEDVGVCISADELVKVKGTF